MCLTPPVMALPLVLCVALLPTAACALRPPAALTRRQCTASAVIAAAGAALPRRANAQDASPSDTAAARLVVDAQAAEPGGAYGTISAALSAAPKGATVLVRPGLYAERLFLKSEVNILADKGAVLAWTNPNPNPTPTPTPTPNPDPNQVLAWKSDRPYEAALTVDLSVAAAPCRVLVQGLEIRP